MDLSIIDDRHRRRVRLSLTNALGHGQSILTLAARQQIAQEELSKLIIIESTDDEDLDI